MQEKDCLRFRHAEPSDVAVIISLVLSSFTDFRLEKMIYSCSGISDFINSQITCDDQYSDTVYYVALKNEVVVGFVQFARDVINSKLYLAYICIAAEFHRQNIGKKLINYAIKSESRDISMIALDVFSENARALKWYSRLGFKEVYRKQWTVVDPNPCIAMGAVIKGRPQHIMSHKQFGFSQFQIVTKLRSYDVGMLESRYFRVSDVDLFDDDQAVAVLQRIESGCRFLLMGALPTNAKVLKSETMPESIHMEIESFILRNRLDMI